MIYSILGDHADHCILDEHDDLYILGEHADHYILGEHADNYNTTGARTHDLPHSRRAR